jgi:peptidoglycan/xylan/chitin deacetylase (PgdA/CDA1 family)/GT2 family glycosyltransferase
VSDVALSVLIATHNRIETLSRALAALAAQTQDPADFEVVIADDASTDGTPAALERMSFPFELRCLALPKQGKPGALNDAIAAARGDVCLFIDDDIMASPELVETHLRAHREDPTTLGIGSLKQKAPRGGDAYARSHASRWNARYRTLANFGVDWADTYGGNFSAPREALRAIGGFDVEIEAIEDIEIGYRLEKHGCKARYLPAADALHDDYKSGPKILLDEERFGGFCAEFVGEHHDARERLIGWIDEPTVREVILRRGLLRLRVPPLALARLGALIPTRRRRAAWFGFVSRYTFWRGVKKALSPAGWRQAVDGVQVLMYHAFSAEEEGDRFVISAATLRRQLRILRLLRYRFVHLTELAEMLRTDERLPGRCAVITIDDGYRDVYEVAFPILRRYRVPATVYLVTDKVGERNDWDDQGAVAARPLLTREQIAEMRAAGIRFGAHTRTHAELPTLAPEALSEQIEGSRAAAEAELGEPVLDLTYPYGRLNDEIVAATAAAGFAAAATTVPRRARRGDEPLRIPRIEVMGSETTRSFLRKLWIGGM